MTAAKPRRLEWIPIDDLPEDRKNPKRHQVDGIADSMGRLGVIDLQVIDERTGKLVSGHGRKRAPAYCDIICARYQSQTGEKPTRDGEPHDFAGTIP